MWKKVTRGSTKEDVLKDNVLEINWKRKIGSDFLVISK
jgi:hypothetical protein